MGIKINNVFPAVVNGIVWNKLGSKEVKRTLTYDLVQCTSYVFKMPYPAKQNFLHPIIILFDGRSGKKIKCFVGIALQ